MKIIILSNDQNALVKRLSKFNTFTIWLKSDPHSVPHFTREYEETRTSWWTLIWQIKSLVPFLSYLFRKLLSNVLVPIQSLHGFLVHLRASYINFCSISSSLILKIRERTNASRNDFESQRDIVTTSRSWGRFSLITLFGTGLRFRREVRQNFSVSTNLDYTTPILFVNLKYRFLHLLWLAKLTHE